MVRTWSARLRRSFTLLATGVASCRANDGQSPSVLIAASLVQSVLLAAIAVWVAIESPAHLAGMAQVFGALAILTSAYVGHAALTGAWLGDGAGNQQNLSQTDSTSRAPASFGDRTKFERDAARDPEQLRRLNACISHELRTPLNAVIGFSDMMHREVLGPVGNEQYREYAAHIRLSAERFQIATQNSLAVTEMLTSARLPSQAVLQLHATVDASLVSFQKSTACTEPTWHFVIDPDVHVICDPHSLDDALCHLWTVGRSLALSSRFAPNPDCQVVCHMTGDGMAELRFSVHLTGARALRQDAELAPGTELGIFLARFAVESAGGEFSLGDNDDDTWCAIVRLPTGRN